MSYGGTNGPEAARRVVIVGAAGRDFHNFNIAFRDDPGVEVCAFTAAQIPGIGGRLYPPVLAGGRYPAGIPIVDEAELDRLVRELGVDEVVFAYSDVTHEHVMHIASRAIAAGADFRLMGPRSTMLDAAVPVIAVTAVRTGCGKSQISRWLSRELRERGFRVAVIRHPMPYGMLGAQAVQRFAAPEDLDAADCTIEEREEYEPHIAGGSVVFAGVDYAAILRRAESECDIVVWDGGNNDFPFVRPSWSVVVTDALRPGQAEHYHPGEAVLRMADVVVINKVDAATKEQVATAVLEAGSLAPGVPIVLGRSPVTLERPLPRGARVLVVEDGPTITHGGAPHGAGFSAALAAGANVVDPRPWLAGELPGVFARFPHIGPVLPAMGYSTAEIHALEQTIEAADVDVVVAGTPIDLAQVVRISKPVIRARYEYADGERPSLAEALDRFLAGSREGTQRGR